MPSPPPIPHDPTDIREITGAIATEQIGQLMEMKRNSNWPKYITLFLTTAAMLVGMVMWATGAHTELRSWTIEQDFVTKAELREVMEKRYVPLHEFTKVQQSLDDYKNDLEKMDKKLDKVLDQLHNQKSPYHRRR